MRSSVRINRQDECVNRAGHPATLVAQGAKRGNRNALRHGVYARGALDQRAAEIAEAVLAAEHTVALDELGAIEIGRLEALIQAMDLELARRGLTNRGGDARSLIDLRLRASRRLSEWLDKFGLNPAARAEWTARLASGGIAGEIARRRTHPHEGSL
jgi:hypothetical protein